MSPTTDHSLIAWSAYDVPISKDNFLWFSPMRIFITAAGSLYVQTSSSHDLPLHLRSLHACLLTINPMAAPAQSQKLLNPLFRKSRKQNGHANSSSASSPSSSSSSSAAAPGHSKSHPVVYIKTYDNQKLFIRCASYSIFNSLVKTLILWQCFRPLGLAKKYFADPLPLPSLTQEPHKVLVGRFKIYGPLPKTTKVKVVPGLKAPIYQSRQELDATSSPSATPDLSQSSVTSSSSSSASTQVTEGWFYTMGVLKSDGVLNFISELDGQLLYSTNVAQLLASEIRTVHHSLFDSSNILFIGILKELRYNNIIRSTTTLSSENYAPEFLVRDGKDVPNNGRLLLEFPLHIDLEDWLVGLLYFVKREYIGTWRSLATDEERREQAEEADGEHEAITAAERKEKQPEERDHSLSSFLRDRLRVSKKLSVDIIEARFTDMSLISGNATTSNASVYAEVRLWGLPWSRTASVPFTSNPFWKEHFSTDLPILTQTFQIFIRRKQLPQGDVEPLLNDEVVGSTFVTPDILARNMPRNSTVANCYVNPDEGRGRSGDDLASLIGSSIPLATSDVTAVSNTDYVHLQIFDAGNVPIGKLLVDVRLIEHHILTPEAFVSFQNMLMNAPMADLVRFCAQEVKLSDFEHVSVAILDIFQILGIEEKWFKALMEHELLGLDTLTRKNYRLGGSAKNAHGEANGSGTSSTTNVFNTLFRGTSIFSKTFEKYIFRIGREYLEKTFAAFFERLQNEGLDCELDPRVVRAGYRAALSKSGIKDEDLNLDEKQWHEARIAEIVNENFKNLRGYAEELWRLISSTSGDLPEKIKGQLASFRSKVELACDPGDKSTALNCLSGFIFLRFLCPVILNPKLFQLMPDHQRGHTQRTLTLLAKILLNLANRQSFSLHKEPHLLKMNDFLQKHHRDMLDYYDRITGRKNDFNAKVLDLTHSMDRFDMGLGKVALANDLLTTPHLLDKHLRLTELIQLLAFKDGTDRAFRNDSLSSGTDLTSSRLNSPVRNGLVRNRSRDVYHIGSLEFEKLELLEFVGNQETEGFIKSLCRSDKLVFLFMDSETTLHDLRKESTKLVNQIRELEAVLEDAEPAPDVQQPNSTLIRAFVSDALNRLFLDTRRNMIVSMGLEVHSFNAHAYRKWTDPATMAALRLKFGLESEGSDHESLRELRELGEFDDHVMLLPQNGSGGNGGGKSLFKKIFHAK